jgi:hypothetical protein
VVVQSHRFPMSLDGGGDCDDTDAERMRWGYADRDGDGRGAGPRICTASPLPSGFSEITDDCDDDDANLFWPPDTVWPPASDCPCERFLQDAPLLEPDPSCSEVGDLVVADRSGVRQLWLC